LLPIGAGGKVGVEIVETGIKGSVGKVGGEIAKGSVDYIGRVLSSQELKSILSYEKLIVEHEKKIANFKANPTIRPGMENLPQDIIKAQQAKRIEHLEKEIQTFKNNIEKIKGTK
jgi:hypothetical protein